MVIVRPWDSDISGPSAEEPLAFFFTARSCQPEQVSADFLNLWDTFEILKQRGGLRHTVAAIK